MSIWKSILKLNIFAKDNLGNSKLRLEIIAILLGGFFAFWKWGLEVYWERQDNYSVYFVNQETDNKKPALYLKNSKTTIADHAYCHLQGMIGISNASAAPLHIENTTLHFLPFDLNQCQPGKEALGKCMVSNTASAIFARLCQSKLSGCPAHKQITIRPVDAQPLFNKIPASRPFDLAIPDYAPHKGLLVIAEQQIGRGCIAKDAEQRSALDCVRSCETSRAFVVDSDGCDQNK